MNKPFPCKIIAFLMTTLIVVSCNNKNNNNETTVVEVAYEQAPTFDYVPATSHHYSIVNKQESSLELSENQSLKKIRYTVEIQTELSKSALDEIADDIASSDSHEYIFVEYYLPTQDKKGPNYGLSKRTPTERTSQINYVAPPKAEHVNVKTPYDGCKVYGKWNMMGAIVIAYQKGNNCYMINYYGGSNYGEPEIYIKTTFRGQTAFKNTEDFNDVYVINQDGNLEGYYCGDLATIFPKAN